MNSDKGKKKGKSQQKRETAQVGIHITANHERFGKEKGRAGGGGGGKKERKKRDSPLNRETKSS